MGNFVTYKLPYSNWLIIFTKYTENVSWHGNRSLHVQMPIFSFNFTQIMFALFQIISEEIAQFNRSKF